MRIFIIGYMGAGQSTIGRRLANRMQLPFIDLDDAFESKFKYSIPRFFDHFGEDRFRELENRCLNEIINDHEDAVISTGGGTACFYENMKLMNKKGISVYIKMHPKSLAQRLKSARRLRPVIRDVQNNEMQSFVESQLHEREAFYKLATITVKGENFDLDELVKLIEQK